MQTNNKTLIWNKYSSEGSNLAKYSFNLKLKTFYFILSYFSFLKI